MTYFVINTLWKFKIKQIQTTFAGIVAESHRKEFIQYTSSNKANRMYITIKG